CTSSTYYELFLAGAPEVTLGGDAEWLYGGPGLVFVGGSASKTGTAEFTFSGTAGGVVGSYVLPLGIGGGGGAVFSSSSLAMEVSFRVILPPGVTCTSASGVFPGCEHAAPPQVTQKSLGGPCTSFGNPCDVATGNKYEEVTDYETAGPNVLAFR